MVNGSTTVAPVAMPGFGMPPKTAVTIPMRARCCNALGAAVLGTKRVIDGAHVELFVPGVGFFGDVSTM